MAAAALAALSACSAVPVPHPAHSDAPTYAQGFADGKRMERERLSELPAFHVSADVLDPFPDEVSSLPKDGEITVENWWASRGRNIWLLKHCRQRDSDKRDAIIGMLDAVRR